MSSPLTPWDTATIIDRVRKNGLVTFVKDEIPEEKYVEWRRDVRRAAKDLDLRITISRRSHRRHVIIEHLDHVTTDAERVAMANAMGDILSGDPSRPRLTWEEQVKRAQRDMMRVVESDTALDGPVAASDG